MDNTIGCLFLQYRNASNPLAHYDGTAQEIVDACDGMFICSFVGLFIQQNFEYFFSAKIYIVCYNIAIYIVQE